MLVLKKKSKSKLGLVDPELSLAKYPKFNLTESQSPEQKDMEDLRMSVYRQCRTQWTKV